MLVIITANSCRTSESNSTYIQEASISAANHVENEHFSIDLPENYFLDKVQGKDGVIYYIESNVDGTIKGHGEIFRGFHHGTVKRYHDDSSKIETMSVEILGQKNDLGIYFEENVYSTIGIIPIKNNNSFGTYIRIIGKTDNVKELYELINYFSTIEIK
jgi:hypothetical protein